MFIEGKFNIFWKLSIFLYSKYLLIFGEK